MKVLTVKEVAEILKLHPRTVTKMVRNGEIPATRIGRVWRFDESAILGWFNDRVTNAAKGWIETEGSVRYWNGTTHVADLLNEKLVQYSAERKSKSEVLEALAALAIRTQRVHDYEQLLESLSEREGMCPTALEGGVAFPHPRHPLDHLDQPVLATLVTRHGVEFGSPDGNATKVFVLVCSPDDRTHVKVLAHLARMFRRDGAVSRLARAHNPKEILRELTRIEKDLIRQIN